jgi:hypothetical protein
VRNADAGDEPNTLAIQLLRSAGDNILAGVALLEPSDTEPFDPIDLQALGSLLLERRRSA